MEMKVEMVDVLPNLESLNTEIWSRAYKVKKGPTRPVLWG